MKKIFKIKKDFAERRKVKRKSKSQQKLRRFASVLRTTFLNADT